MEPTTELDPPFSDAGVRATPWRDVQQALEAAEMFWVTTVRADGRPHMTPLVAVWLDDAVYFCTGPGEQKAVNLQSNQHVILSTGCNHWDRGIDVVIEGSAARIIDDVKLRRLAESWRMKWDGRWQFEVSDGAFREGNGDGHALVFEVAPSKVLSFAKEPFVASRHTF